MAGWSCPELPDGYDTPGSQDAWAGTAAGLKITDEGFNQEDGWGYYHFLLQKARQ